jgi:hypothetical protein
MGVRTLRGVPPPSLRTRRHPGGYFTLGAAMGTAPDPDTLNELTSAGYDPGMLQTLVAMGATNEQLQSLPYPADPNEMAAAEQALMSALSAPSTGSTQVAQDVGTLQSQANNLVAQVKQMQTELAQMTQAAAAALAAGHPWPLSVAQQLTQQQNDLNSIISQVQTVYRAAFGTGAPGLSGLGVDPVTIAAAAAAVSVILAAIALWWQHENTLKAQIAVQQTQANTQQQAVAAANQQSQSLIDQANILDQQGNAAAAKGDYTSATALHAQATSLRNQAAAIVKAATQTATGGDVPTQIGEFFQKYWPYFALGAGALIVLPMLTGKRR